MNKDTKVNKDTKQSVFANRGQRKPLRSFEKCVSRLIPRTNDRNTAIKRLTRKTNATVVIISPETIMIFIKTPKSEIDSECLRDKASPYEMQNKDHKVLKCQF